MPVKTITTMKLKSCFISWKAVVVIQEDGVRKEMELNAGDMYHPAKKHLILQFDLRVQVGYRAQTCWSRICRWTTMVL
jgi:hypothetical protein